MERGFLEGFRERGLGGSFGREEREGGEVKVGEGRGREGRGGRREVWVTGRRVGRRRGDGWWRGGEEDGGVGVGGRRGRGG